MNFEQILTQALLASNRVQQTYPEIERSQTPLLGKERISIWNNWLQSVHVVCVSV